MARLRRPLPLTVATMAALVLVLLLALAAGADAAALFVGAGTVAAAFAVTVAVWLRAGERAAARRSRKAERAAKRRQRRALEAVQRRARKQMRLTEELVRGSERRVYALVEAGAWLDRELQMAHPLPLTRARAATPDLLAELVQLIDQLEPATIVELGSGVSTSIIARRLQQRGRGRVVSLEHLERFADLTRADLSRYGLQDVATVVHAPLRDHTIGDEQWPWYDADSEIPDGIELLLVDGPPVTTRRPGRYPALPLLEDRLAPNAVIVLDDGDRPDEHELIARWEREFAGLDAEYLPLIKGAWRVTMRG